MGQQNIMVDSRSILKNSNDSGTRGNSKKGYYNIVKNLAIQSKVFQPSK